MIIAESLSFKPASLAAWYASPPFRIIPAPAEPNKPEAFVEAPNREVSLVNGKPVNL